MENKQNSGTDTRQAEISNSKELPLPSPSRADLRTDGSPDSEKIEHSVRKHKCETLRAWSKSKTGMSEAKVEQQSTETLSFRCWCERCRLTRGRRVKQSRATELGRDEVSIEIDNLQSETSAQEPLYLQERGRGEVSTFNSATVKQLQKPNNVTDLRSVKQKRAAFTLAEVLITLGIVGVVAALTLPALLTNVQERIKKEQVRTIKYKLTQATDSMKSLNLIGPYATTEDFVNELKKHYKISKVCSNDKLRGCWPSDTISTPDGVVQVSSLKTGASIKALALGTSATQTMGIVTADGTPMILAYSPVCNALDSSKTYLWSTVDNKPETNATTNCISAIFDINGAKQPNKIGTDVRTLNSLFGSKQYSATFITKEECLKNKNRLGINGCYYAQDYWAGAVKKCNDIGMHLPSMQTLANIAGAKYGRSDIDTYTLIMMNEYTNDTDYTTSTGNCMDYFKSHNYGNRLSTSNVICVDGAIPNGANSSVASMAGDFWSSSEVSASTAQRRSIYSSGSTWGTDSRGSGRVPLCVGD